MEHDSRACHARESTPGSFSTSTDMSLHSHLLILSNIKRCTGTMGVFFALYHYVDKVRRSQSLSSTALMSSATQIAFGPVGFTKSGWPALVEL